MTSPTVVHVKPRLSHCRVTAIACARQLNLRDTQCQVVVVRCKPCRIRARPSRRVASRSESQLMRFTVCDSGGGNDVIEPMTIAVPCPQSACEKVPSSYWLKQASCHIFRPRFEPRLKGESEGPRSSQCRANKHLRYMRCSRPHESLRPLLKAMGYIMFTSERSEIRSVALNTFPRWRRCLCSYRSGVMKISFVLMRSHFLISRVPHFCAAVWFLKQLFFPTSVHRVSMHFVNKMRPLISFHM